VVKPVYYAVFVYRHCDCSTCIKCIFFMQFHSLRCWSWH